MQATLPSDVMLNINDLFPSSSPVRKELLRRHLVGPVANVQGFGAKGNGIADDTRAIQAAIDFTVTQGGGTVYIPTGTYKIMPQRDATGSPEINALTIHGDNVHLMGDGPGTTRLLFRVAGDRDPSDSFDIISQDNKPAVWRGSGIAIIGTNDIERRRRDIVIENLEIDGGAYPGNTWDRTWPVPPESGAGWDITHKGIYIISDRFYRQVKLANLHLHNFRGEIIYGGGDSTDEMLIENCDIHSTNGVGISSGSTQIVRSNRVYDCASGAIESYHFAKRAAYLGNYFSNMRGGINIQTNWNSPTTAIITGNTFTECRNVGILMNIENGPTIINDNVFIDCGYENMFDATIQIGPGKGVIAPAINNIVVRDNAMLRQSRSGGFGVYLSCEDGRTLKNIFVSDNFIGSAASSATNRASFFSPIGYSFAGKPRVEAIVVSDNLFSATQRTPQNMVLDYPKSAAPMPLMTQNKMLNTPEGIHLPVITDGKTATRLQNEGPTALAGPSDGKVVIPVLVPADYAPGQKLILTGDSAKRRLYVPQSSDIYECREGRFLSPGVFLTLECDGKKFFEVEYVDRRVRHYAEIMDGSVIDADGHPTVYLSVSSERRFTAFEGIGHGAQLRLIATTNNVTIVHNDAIQLGAGTDYQMVANEVKLFFRSRDGVLRKI
jgi:hypothetical protein